MRYTVSSLAGVLLCLLLSPPTASAQYFGRNKVQYNDFDFKVFKTEHFEFYYYPEAEQAVQDAARMAERWYQRHANTFGHTFTERKPVILYANDADFHQTNAISGALGEGTGGVTEGLKQRVVMPLTGIYGENDHVLGHELVHSFQYDIGLAEQDGQRFNLAQMPLWLMEGTAEYLSIGREDPHTAMWLRDAALRDDLPTLDKLTSKPYKYFPYRYGEAYMAYIGGKYGDAAVANLYKTAGHSGIDSAFVYVLGIDPDSLSNEWIGAVKEAYLPLTEGRTPADSAGQPVLAKDLDGGRFNVAPVVSPDGKYVAFLSERDVFTINLFIADAETGKVVKKLKETNRNPHFDAIRFISSAGSWSPDGKQFAFITFANGDNEIAVWNLDQGGIERRVAVDGVTALLHLAWSPDGKYIAFSGMDGGISDLYLLDVETNAVRQLTNDRYGDLQPAWSPDGKTIAFATDRGDAAAPGTDFETLTYAKMRLGLIDVQTGAIDVRRPLGDALHHNPQFSPDGRSLLFISDKGGFKDIYRLDLATGATTPVTHLQTGVSGITALSPAMSVAAQSGRMLFSVFGDGGYSVFGLEEEAWRNPAANDQLAARTGATGANNPDLAANDSTGTGLSGGTPTPGTATADAGMMPPWSAVGTGLVSTYLMDPADGLPAPQDYEGKDYKSRLTLDYVAPPSLGVSIGGFYGGGLYSGIGFFFSDMLGNQNLGIGVQMNGGLKDLGGEVSYINRAHRFNYGVAAAHIPYRYGGYQYTTSGLAELRQRIFIDQASLVGSYALSTTRRVEATAGVVRYGFDYQLIQYGFNGGRDVQNLAAPDAIHLLQAGLAYVGDYSNFAYTSPVQGGRYRFQVAPYFGTESFVNVTADVRRYFFHKPFTFAVRATHSGNYGASEDDIFGAEYLGYSYYGTFVRGYGFRTFDASECSTADCPEAARLSGTRIALASAELRIPLLGSEAYGLVNFPYLPTELSLFTDAGLAWSAESPPVLKFSRNSAERTPVVSVGVSTRFNLFNALVLEVFYAYPFQRPQKGAHFGIQLSPGW